MASHPKYLWLWTTGLEKIYELTNTPTRYEVRFDLGLGSEKVYAVYDYFKLGSAKQKFTLTVGNYRGNAGGLDGYCTVFNYFSILSI